MPAKLKIHTIKFKAGKGAGAPPLETKVGSALILVGPNNSGKSQAIREIRTWCIGRDETRLIVDDLTIEGPQNQAEVEELLEPLVVAERAAEDPTRIFFQAGQPVGDFATQSPPRGTIIANQAALRSSLVQHLHVMLDVDSRSRTLQPKSAGHMDQPDRNLFHRLLRHPDNLNQIRGHLFDVFGHYFVISFLSFERFYAYFGVRPPNEQEEQSIKKEAAEYFRTSAKPLTPDNFGDGTVAYAAIIAALLGYPYRIAIIDEAEAYLHPPLVRRLAHKMLDIAKTRNGSLIASTHSADFLLGCLDYSPSDVTVVRLEYLNGVATAKTLPPSDLAKLMQDPLIRGASPLKGLFHKCTVVTEAEADRAFYDEVNLRLNRVNRGIQDAHFTQGQDWKSVFRIVPALRSFGVPTAGIVDIDVVSSETDFIRLGYYSSIGIPDKLAANLDEMRGKIRAPLTDKQSRKEFKLTGGANIGACEKGLLIQFCSRLEEYGLFVVPVGQLENWLAGTVPPLAGSHKRDWIEGAFSTLGLDPRQPSYVAAGSGDVWGFIDRIGSWTRNPNRLGMP